MIPVGSIARLVQDLGKLFTPFIFHIESQGEREIFFKKLQSALRRMEEFQAFLFCRG